MFISYAYIPTASCHPCVIFARAPTFTTAETAFIAYPTAGPVVHRQKLFSTQRQRTKARPMRTKHRRICHDGAQPLRRLQDGVWGQCFHNALYYRL